MTNKLQRKWFEMEKLEELMVITMEECGELIQECSKSIRKNHYYNNRELTEEVGDVMCMIELLVEYDIISQTNIDERVFEKKKKLLKWSNLL